MPQAGEDRYEVMSFQAETSTAANATETHEDERDYPTDNDEEDDDSNDDDSDSDDDDIPLGPLGQLAKSERDRCQQHYVASQGRTDKDTERTAALVWRTWEDATMLLRLREQAMWRREYYATEDDLASLEVIRDYMNQPGFEEMWSQRVSQIGVSEPWREVISGATENEEASTITLFQQSLEEWTETARRQKADLAETDASDSLPPAPRPPGPPRPLRHPSSSAWPSIFLAEEHNKRVKGARTRRTVEEVLQARKNPNSRRSESSKLKRVRSVDDPSSGESEHAEKGKAGSSTAGGFI